MPGGCTPSSNRVDENATLDVAPVPRITAEEFRLGGLLSAVTTLSGLDEEPGLFEPREHTLAGLLVERSESHAFIHRDRQARRLLEFCSDPLHQ
jgi:hypothetical protein